MKNKKAMIDNVVGLAIGIIIIATITTIGIVLLGNFASSQATDVCAAAMPTGTLNLSTGYCCNATYCSTVTGGVAAESAYYAATKMGNGTGGLLTWLPVIIPAVIGIGIIGYFMGVRRVRGQGY